MKLPISLSRSHFDLPRVVVSRQDTENGILVPMNNGGRREGRRAAGGVWNEKMESEVDDTRGV